LSTSLFKSGTSPIAILSQHCSQNDEAFPQKPLVAHCHLCTTTSLSAAQVFMRLYHKPDGGPGVTEDSPSCRFSVVSVPDLAHTATEHLCWQEGQGQCGQENEEGRRGDRDSFFQCQWLVSRQHPQCLYQLSNRASRNELPGKGTA